jgi:drug/metabolite transporter (DMT)-like permease
MVLALAAAALYGSADFLGGTASRRASAFAVLAVTMPAGAIVMLAATALSGLAGGSGAIGWTGLTWTGAGWAAAAGTCGALGLIAFYTGFAAAPMSVVAPVAALVATVLPVGSAIAAGERVGPTVAAGVLTCVAAVVLVSAVPAESGQSTRRLSGVCYAFAAGVAFGLFFLFLKNAGASGVIWPVALSRTVGTLIALACCALTRTRPVGWRGGGGGALGIALASGAVDALANACYVLATRAGLFGLAVVLTSLYPGVTVLLARVVLGERMRWVQRFGLALAAAGVILVTV